MLKDLLGLNASLTKELPCFDQHIVEENVVTIAGKDRILKILRLDGICFDLVSDQELDSNYDAINGLVCSISKTYSPNVNIWTYFVREKLKNKENTYTSTNTFLHDFYVKYMDRFNQEEYFDDSFYIAIVLKYDDLELGIKDMKDLFLELRKGLHKYNPIELGTYQETNFAHKTVIYSEIFEFLYFLINGYKKPCPLALDEPFYLNCADSDIFFGYDLFEIRNENQQKFGACYDLRSFPQQSYAGMFDVLLSEKMEFILTQSFVPYILSESDKKISKQINKLVSVKDRAEDQIEDLEEARGLVSSNRLTIGEYHGALTIFDQNVEILLDKAATLVATFNTVPASWSKARQSAPITYLSQLPFCKVKPRKYIKSSRSFTGAFSMHTFAKGKAFGNPIGDGSAVMPLQTQHKTIYNFNFHYTPKHQNNLGQKIAGHTLILGATGTGKTTTQLTLLAFLERFNPKIFAMDKDRGMELYLRAIGGNYFTIKAGEPTGFAPLQLEDTVKNREFLYSLVQICGQDNNAQITDEEGIKIKIAVDTVLSLPKSDRVFSRLLESISFEGDNCLATRLKKWCYAHDGRYAWVFDNPYNNFNVEDFYKVGFDITDFLKDNYTPSEPILAYLFHLKELMQQDGEFLVFTVEEFWKPAQFPTTREKIQDALKTGRKRSEIILLVSQSPEDAINSPIFAAIRDQTSTKIFLPNPAAEYESYKKCHLNQKEFDKLKALAENSRTFLIKQSHESCFAMLDLYGFDDELAIISGSTDNIVLMDEIIKQYGDDPEVWIPIFQQQRKER
jgi:type IV secretion system protein VirB4